MINVRDVEYVNEFFKFVKTYYSRFFIFILIR